ncbi:MAG: DUF1127 domain-containing protein [Paracoccaceae bacterium]
MTVHTHDRALDAPVLRGWSLSALAARLRLWHRVARERRALARLSPAQLRDIGLDEDAAALEAQRAFWDAPRNWRL